jgi:hypothetical protein
MKTGNWYRLSDEKYNTEGIEDNANHGKFYYLTGNCVRGDCPSAQIHVMFREIKCRYLRSNVGENIKNPRSKIMR